MGSQDRDGEGITAELLQQMREQSDVLGVFDEGQDIALDLHTELFDPSTRTRALAFLQSKRYEHAVQTYQRLSTGPIDLQDPQSSPGGAS